MAGRPNVWDQLGPNNTGFTLELLTPMGGQQLVQAGAPFDFELPQGERKLIEVQLDVPTDVSFDLYVNDRILASGRDLGGAAGSVILGNPDGSRYTVVRTLRLAGVNELDLAQDIRAWVLGVP